MKQIRGEIHSWKKIHFVKSDYPDLPDNLGYAILGTYGRSRRWMTSPVVAYDESTKTIETLNSFYKLVGEEVDE